MNKELNDYMSSLIFELDEKQAFYNYIETFLYEAWGGCPEALYNLAKHICHDYPYQEMAECFYKESAKMGYAPAMFRQAEWALFYAHSRSDSAAAIRLLKKAAKAGSSEAYNLLGDMFKTGKAVKKNAKRAKRYYDLAANNTSAINLAA